MLCNGRSTRRISRWKKRWRCRSGSAPSRRSSRTSPTRWPTTRRTSCSRRRCSWRTTGSALRLRFDPLDVEPRKRQPLVRSLLAALEEAVDRAVRGDGEVAVRARPGFERAGDGPGRAVVFAELDGQILPVAVRCVVGVAEEKPYVAERNQAGHADGLRQRFVEPDRRPLADAGGARGDAAEDRRFAGMADVDHDAPVRKLRGGGFVGAFQALAGGKHFTGFP